MMIVTPASTDESVQESINGRLYQKANLVSTYAPIRLFPAEATALIRYRDDIAGRRVLDLGCGSGRLTYYLRPLTSEYVGMDVSHHMIEHCRGTFSQLRFVQGDMRNLNEFDEGSFEMVVAVSNLFDAVSHLERLRVLDEVRRVLTPRGLLVFSAHNRNYARAGAGPRLQLHRNPFTQMRSLVEHVRATVNHHRIKPHQRFEADYALLNDSGNNFNTLHYYVTRDAQVRQLAEAGYEVIECLDECGYTLRPGDKDDENASIFYVSRRNQ